MERYYIACIDNLPDPKVRPSSILNLPLDRQEKCLRFKKSEGRKLSLGAGKIIERMLADGKIKAPLTQNENGKPQCEGLHFNISHSGKYVIGVSSDAQVGCDIELREKAPLEVAKRFFHPSELLHMEQSPDPNIAFWTLWTLKESYMKMTGEGFKQPLGGFEIRISEGIKAYVHGKEQPCVFRSFSLDGYSVSICRAFKSDSFFDEISWINVT